MSDVKQQVQEFYNQVGWQEVAEGQYQNARYEDLRPVSKEYIHRCHMRVARYLPPRGRFLLDAGSGPIQYPEYLEYSRGYARRVCADISIVALEEARKRIGDHGFFVVADIANLPFKPGAFDGAVSLHTIHHLPLEEHSQAYSEINRVLANGGTAVVVNGWDNPPISAVADRMIGAAQGAAAFKRRILGPRIPETNRRQETPGSKGPALNNAGSAGTYVRKHNARWLKEEIGKRMPVEILVWRTFNIHFLRTFVHSRLGGRLFLRCLYALEERFPHFLGENGQYPLIILHKD